jgi:transposase-like protein
MGQTRAELVMSEFKWRHFEGEVILWAVRWYCRYGISYRDLEQMMGERGALLDHSTIYRWVQKYAPEIEKRLRWQWRRPHLTSWRVDETYGTPSQRSLVCMGVMLLEHVWNAALDST